MTEFQLGVASRWLDDARRANGVPSFEFVAYFSALNALYWLWGMAEGRTAFTDEERSRIESALEIPEVTYDLRSRVGDKLRGLRSERALIEQAVEQLGEEKAKQILEAHADFIRYLCEERLRPIHRMDVRSRDNTVGDERMGKAYLETLKSSQASDTKKIKALAGTLYLIRCNLVHGSKVMDAEDQDLVQRAVPPLRSITEAVLNHTEHARPR